VAGCYGQGNEPSGSHGGENQVAVFGL